MATAGRRTTTPVSSDLLQNPARFEFFQAVRLLEQLAESGSEGAGRRPRRPVGHDARPAEECVRFRATQTLTFPSGDISRLEAPAARGEAQDLAGGDRPPELLVNFIGLTGPNGALPQHYTSLVIERAHSRNKDYALREFFDLFNHRITSFFYRAWEKYRVAIGYERFRRAGAQDRRDTQAPSDDLFTLCLCGLVGLGTGGLRGRMQVDDETILYYGGHYSRHPRSASPLQSILGDYFGFGAEVRQFQGQWLHLHADDQSAFGAKGQGGGRNLALGESTVAGAKVRDFQGKFRVRIGPLTLDQFNQVLPEGRNFRLLCELVRLYAGPEFDFDVQVVLRADEVPFFSFTDEPARAPRLGWNTWLQSAPPLRDADDAVFLPVTF